MTLESSAPHVLGDDDGQRSIVHEYDAETPASLAVIHAICALTDVDPIDAPTELGFVLHEHVAPNALDTLLADGTGDGALVVSFEVTNGDTYAVEIADDGQIVVEREE